MHFRQLEMAGFSAWPAHEQIESTEMVIRFANGYTKRANSANILQLTNSDFAAVVLKVEDYFAEKKQPSIFRIPTFVDAAGFDDYLQEQGYVYQDNSYVFDLPLTNYRSPKTILDNAELLTKDPYSWMQSYCQLGDSSFNAHYAHLEILRNIKDKMFPLVLKVNGEEVACALAVNHQGYLGVFDVLTAKPHRGRGYARYLLEAMLALGVAEQAKYSYLQVVATNEVAISLYQQLGYQKSYEYGYRIKG